MTATTTVVFADLTGSTGMFEALGNAAATQAITSVTQDIGSTCRRHGGRVVKSLGDGVLALFPHPDGAVEATVQMQREHARGQVRRAPAQRMQLQVGLACGDIVEKDGDCFGDAVNLAARLSELSGARQIWATASVIDQLRVQPAGTRLHALGPVPIRGKAQAHDLYRIEWQEDTSTDMMTLPGVMAQVPVRGDAAAPATIELRFMDVVQAFGSDRMPVHLGRAREAEFVVADPRVSRLHASIGWSNSSFVLADLSSFGTCVRFAGTSTELKLRRDHCVLHHDGEIALGADFSDWSVPTVLFALKPR